MQFTISERKKFDKNSYESFILGGDIGGTNCNLGIFGIKDSSPELAVSFHFESKKISNLYSPINEALDNLKKNYGINATKACLGIAGAVSYKRDYVHLTNAKLDISTEGLRKNTLLKGIFLMNDFEALGYGINMLAKKDFEIIKKGEKIQNGPIAVIGAGTGLGKTTLLYHKNKKMYVPSPSEAHHSDFPARYEVEQELAGFIKKHRKIRESITNGDILSGEGLENIYLFLRKGKKFGQTRYTKEVDSSGRKPELISEYRKADATCRETFRIFRNAYAGFARNVALDSLAYGGVYIAGGIAPKNREIFNNEFIKIFEESRMMRKVLEKIPVYLVLNHDAGLLGAGFAGAKIQIEKISENG